MHGRFNRSLPSQSGEFISLEDPPRTTESSRTSGTGTQQGKPPATTQVGTFSKALGGAVRTARGLGKHPSRAQSQDKMGPMRGSLPAALSVDEARAQSKGRNNEERNCTWCPATFAKEPDADNNRDLCPGGTSRYRM